MQAQVLHTLKTGFCGQPEAGSCLVAGPALGLTNGVQQAGVAPALQPIAEALSKADAAARRSEAMTPTQPAQVRAHSEAKARLGRRCSQGKSLCLVL